MSEHTKEPWQYHTEGNRSFLLDADGYTIAELVKLQPAATVHDARRIVACVNACSGIDIEYLEGNDSLPHFAKRMMMQRNELLAALKRAQAHIDEITTLGGKYHGLHGEIVQDSYAESAAAAAAIAKAEAV
jgi:hypothetical protein